MESKFPIVPPYPYIFGFGVLIFTFLSIFSFTGYKGVFKKRTKDKPDGCAIFWKNELFSFQGKLGIDYYQPHVPLLDRDNVGLLVKLQSRVGRRPKVVVGTTHLLYNPKRNVSMSMILNKLNTGCMWIFNDFIIPGHQTCSSSVAFG
jgi:hypothetical protein